jgi:hypothetical protein
MEVSTEISKKSLRSQEMYEKFGVPTGKPLRE